MPANDILSLVNEPEFSYLLIPPRDSSKLNGEIGVEKMGPFDHLPERMDFTD